ncbi:MAG: SMI1/KNR4 family protein [Deltaproteobacteria bacterium]|nr:SMI1/KNR4 family protein [Deltaproteobacteria bacterium]
MAKTKTTKTTKTTGTTKTEPVTSRAKRKASSKAFETTYATFLELRRIAVIPDEPASPVSAERLAAWETDNRITLPADLRSFLLRFGDGAPGFPAPPEGAKARRMDHVLRASPRALDAARRPVEVDVEGMLPSRLTHGTKLELCPFLTLNAKGASVSKRFDADTVANGMLSLGRADDGSLYYVALNGEAAGKIFVLSLGNDYEGMFSTGETFAELMESYIAWAMPKVKGLVTLAKAIQEQGEAIWKSTHAAPAVMSELRRMLKGADDVLAARLLDIASQCPSMRGRSGHLDFEVGQQLVYAMSHLVEHGRTSLLRDLLRRFLAEPQRSKLHPVVCDLALFVMLDDAAKGELTLDYARAFSLVDGEPELNRTEEECRRALLALPEVAQAKVLALLPFQVLGGLMSQELLGAHGERIRTSLAECLEHAHMKPTLTATAAIYDLARFLSNALRFPKGTNTRESLAKSAAPLLPLFATASSVLPRNEKQYADLPEALAKLANEIGAAAGSKDP